MKTLITCIIILLFRIPSSSGSVLFRTVPDSIRAKIDKLFAEYDNKKSPGCAVGIVMGDTLIFARGYGMANLEYDIPITPETAFQVASVSKQFTAYCTLLLAKEGKLKLNDDVRKYLAWFPNMHAKITIRNLLNHTSGIRDQWQLMVISGTRLEDVITQEHIIKLLSEQRTLNFRPGEQYSYSNSGYTIMAEIIGTITHHSLRQYSDSAIFRPLGMNDTHFLDDYREIIENRSYSYGRIDSNNFVNSILNYANVGATNLFTNVRDMSRWIMNFYEPKVGDRRDIELLTRNSILNDSTVLNYGLGIGLEPYKGLRQFSHSGADAGYRTNISVFPDLRMGFIVFSNLADFDPVAKTHAIADLFLNDSAKENQSSLKEPADSTQAILSDTLSVMKFLGHYISDEGIPLKLNLNDKKLYYQIYDETKLLVKDSSNVYSIFGSPEIRFILNFQQNDTSIEILSANSYFHLTKYNKYNTQDDKFLSLYTGSYYSPELDTKYNIVLRDHELWLTNSKYNRTKLALVNEDHLTNGFWWMNHLRIMRNNRGLITGFEVNCGRINHLQFLRMNTSGSRNSVKFKKKQREVLL